MVARGRCGCTAAGSGRTADDVHGEPHPLLPRDLLHAIQELRHPRALDLALRLHLHARVGAFRVAHQRARARRLVVAAARRHGARVDPADAVRLHLRVGLRQPRRRALAVLRVGRRRRVGTAPLGAAVLDKLAPLAVAPRHAARRRVVTEVEAEVLHHRQSDRRDRRPPAVPAVELRAARHELRRRLCAETLRRIRIARAAHDMTSSRITRVSQCDAPGRAAPSVEPLPLGVVVASKVLLRGAPRAPLGEVPHVVVVGHVEHLDQVLALPAPSRALLNCAFVKPRASENCAE